MNPVFVNLRHTHGVLQTYYDVYLQARFKEFKVQNMVGSCDVKFPIRLEGLVVKHGQFSSYEPELFPGLIYRMVRPKIVLLIFVSGKVVLTGTCTCVIIYSGPLQSNPHQSNPLHEIKDIKKNSQGN